MPHKEVPLHLHSRSYDLPGPKEKNASPLAFAVCKCHVPRVSLVEHFIPCQIAVLHVTSTALSGHIHVTHLHSLRVGTLQVTWPAQHQIGRRSAPVCHSTDCPRKASGAPHITLVVKDIDRRRQMPTQVAEDLMERAWCPRRVQKGGHFIHAQVRNGTDGCSHSLALPTELATRIRQRQQNSCSAPSPQHLWPAPLS